MEHASSALRSQSSDFLFSGARDAFWKAVYAAVG